MAILNTFLVTMPMALVGYRFFKNPEIRIIYSISQQKPLKKFGQKRGQLRENDQKADTYN